MISEDVLERGLAAAAEEYDVPAGAVDRLRERIAPSVAMADEGGEPPRRRRMPRPQGWQWLPVAAAGLAVLIAVPIALGGPSDTAAPAASHGVSQALPTPTPASRAQAFNGLDSPSAATDSLSVAGAGSAGAPVPAPAKVPDGARASLTYSNAAPVQQAPVAQPNNSVQDSTDQPAPPLDSQERIVRTGAVDLQVAKNGVQGAVDKLHQLASSEGGFVDSSELSSHGDDVSATVTMRVPVAKFDDALDQAQTYGTKVLDLRTSSADVTGKYVDLSARIRSAERNRSVLQTILSKATTIGQTLTVQSRIDAVQTDIERLTAQRKMLANQSALSTLTVNVNQPTPVIETTPKHNKQSGLSKAFHTSVDRFMNGVEAIIGIIGPVLLVLILIALAYVIGKLGYRRFRRSLV